MFTENVVLIILAIIFIFVVVPLIVMGTVEIQRKLMFPNFDQPENPQYENFELYDAVGVRNIYITVDDLLDINSKVSLGVWQVIPEIDLPEWQKNKNGYDFDKALNYSTKPIAIYFHGNSGTRIYPYDTYKIMRKFFHVIAFDYRSYGDSTEALLTEPAVVNDALQLYENIAKRTKNSGQPIYVWGHSLGTALSTHTVKRIFEGSYKKPSGLVLEAPFTTMREEIPHHPFGKFFAWLPWFNATIQDPIEKNGFLFRTRHNILSVDCPIMIVHAEDDSVIPYTLGKELSEVAKDAGKTVTYHQIPNMVRSDHMGAHKWMQLPDKIQNFLDGTRRMQSGKRKSSMSNNATAED